MGRFAADAPHNEEQRAKAEVVVTPDGGTLNTGTLDAPLELAGDWSGVLRGFGLDPSVFEVIDDTVKMSKWQTSRRIESGDRDVVWLWSYSARFRRRLVELEAPDVDAIRRRIAKWRPRATRKTTDAAPSTFVACWADWQVGKSAGGGVETTVARIEQSYELTVARIRELRKAGRNIERVAVLNMGDPLEGCDGHYESQRATVQLTQREQLNLVLDLWTNGVLALEADVFASVLCNHGEWTRQGPGSRPITSDSDNAGGFLGDTLQRVFDGTGTGPTEWHVPHDEMISLVDLSGVAVGLAHGHKMPGTPKELEWLRGQSIRLLRDHGHEPRLWVTAHRHHVDVKDFGPWWRIQCPTLDGGSKWYEDTSGIWSTPGTMTFLAGTHDVRGFSDLQVLGGRR